jgi:hypothetical protein
MNGRLGKQLEPSTVDCATAMRGRALARPVDVVGRLPTAEPGERP